MAVLLRIINISGTRKDSKLKIKYFAYEIFIIISSKISLYNQNKCFPIKNVDKNNSVISFCLLQSINLFM